MDWLYPLSGLLVGIIVGLTGVGGGLGHAALGTVDFVLLGSLLLGSLPGIWLGSHLSSHVRERVLRSLLATMLLIIGGKFVL